MASKNLGAVIQRAISDGAFRRQLQSDPAAALRGFNLTPTEIAAIRSGDASKLMSLGVDQRVSKAFTVSGGFLGTREAVSDMGTGAQSSGIIGDPTSGARDAITSGNPSGTRAVNDSAPFDSGRLGVTDPTLSGTRAVNDSEPFDGGRSTVSDPNLSGTRAVHDSAPFDSGRLDASDPSMSTRAVHDVAPFEGNANAAATPGDPYSGQYQGVSPDFQARLGDAATGSQDLTRAVNDVAPFDASGRGGSLAAFPDSNAGAAGDAQIAADDNYSVSSRMADAGTSDATRAIHDVAPFDSGVNTAAPSGGEFLGDIQHDPGDVSKTFVPSDSADVQREMLDGTTGDGGALGNTGSGHPS